MASSEHQPDQSEEERACLSEGWEGKHKVKLHNRMDHLTQEVAHFEDLLLGEMVLRWKIETLEQEEHIVAEKVGLLEGRLRAVREQIEGLKKERCKIPTWVQRTAQQYRAEWTRYWARCELTARGAASVAC